MTFIKKPIEEASPEPSDSKDEVCPGASTRVGESTTNQRQYQRYEIDTDLTAILSSEHEAGAMKGRSLDISEAGIAGVFVTGWEIGTPVLLEFSVPVASRRVLVGAVVRNRSGYRYGFLFVNLSEEQREIISRTCRVLALLR